MRAPKLIGASAAVLAVAFGAAAAPASSLHREGASPPPVASSARSCSSGFTRARIDGVVKCLRVGEYCAHRYDRHAPRRWSYRHYGFRCVKRDSRGAYHLTRR